MNDGEIIESEEQPRPKMGRPPKYLPQFAVVARQMCKMGATDWDLAQAFGVDTGTIWAWQTRHADFCEAVKLDKGDYDSRVERSLAQRAVGYTYNSEKVHIAKDGTVTRVPIVEHVPPDPSAAKNWLAARRAKEWNQAANVNIQVEDGTGQLLSDQELARRVMAIIDSADRGGIAPIPLVPGKLIEQQD